MQCGGSGLCRPYEKGSWGRAARQLARGAAQQTAAKQFKLQALLMIVLLLYNDIKSPADDC